MHCPNCTIRKSELSFQIPLHIKEIICQHFSHHSRSFTWNNNILHTSEAASNDLVDFLKEMDMDTGVSFKPPHQDWMNLEKYDTYRNSSWLDDLIKAKNIRMYFQPIITQTGMIYGYEMLARFFDDAGTIVYPDKVFPAAKLRGRTFALDRLCRMQGVRQIKRLYDDQKAFINFIPTAIYQPEYCLRTTAALANSLSIKSNRFVFEVVETEQVDDADHLKSILTYYQNNGFDYALDDVGSGYNTLDLLGELKPPYVKLDMTISQGVSQCPEKQAIAIAFLKKAKHYGAMGLAEGIENLRDFDWLKDKGYDLFQGYLFGKPLPDPLEEKIIDLNQF
ncbi:EAL domain, c-di-GMP-specific phosphodiesterase class I (or its enzymatically inactive variant) [Alkalibacterium subtropicum]|uniref:EAL domain, c-di-GMP-specific phosphodiesterase class I (Or its enzymatically inactive variant) n=1 Tax=Alkalibacterium subtropicum TaxID=753702 RepID=A0A1I1HEY8_9LACT|nr:EAL domain-containing protein [Alkalibacterium subtropicum]SFC22275.1 EAL domain, c-di-GMP-specific phosphodiesterase class I (or its enzymatically inactive variant) [Alkalibacterium subtropicum]